MGAMSRGEKNNRELVVLVDPPLSDSSTTGLQFDRLGRIVFCNERKTTRKRIVVSLGVLPPAGFLASCPGCSLFWQLCSHDVFVCPPQEGLREPTLHAQLMPKLDNHLNWQNCKGDCAKPRDTLFPASPSRKKVGLTAGPTCDLPSLRFIVVPRKMTPPRPWDFAG